MTQGESLLDEAELDFLLQQADVQTAEDLFDPTDSDTTKVTIRGDLDNISLADIFQTLSISKMRGILKVFNPLETRLVYFDQGTVRLMNANRKGTRRIGQRLVRCGVLSTAQLRQALLEQKKQDIHLGEILIELGFLSEDELTTVLNNQLEEDLHNIFIWSSGNFEFYKNKPDDDEILEGLKKNPGFEVNGILLEAARRRDEWGQIIGQIGSIHAIPVFPHDVEFPEMSGSALAVCEAIDNFSTISDLAESTMLGIFNCAKSVCDLKRDGLVELADPKLTLELAHDATRKSDTKRALQLCQNLKQHAGDLDFELCEELATVLEACREPRLSASILLECATNLEEPNARIGIGQRALGVDRHAISVMEFLRKEMLDADRTDDDDYRDILDKLSNALSSDGQDEAALGVFTELEALTKDKRTLLVRKAKLLQRVGRDEEALAVLFQLRNEFEEQGDKGRLTNLYEQILKLDPSQKEVAKALKVIRIGKSKTRLRKIYTFVTVAVILGASLYAWRWSELEKEIQGIATEVRSVLDNMDAGEARRLLAEAEARLGAQNMWVTLQSEVSQVVLQVNHAAVKKRVQANIAALAVVSDALKEGKLEKALGLYRELLKNPEAAKLVRKNAKGQLKRITMALQTIRDELKNNLPAPIPPLANHESLKAAEAILELKSKIDTSLARTMLVTADNPTIKELWPPKDLELAKSLAIEIQSLAQVAARRLLNHRERIRKNEKNMRLDPVFTKAREAEDVNDFKTAERLYQQLLQEYAGNPNLEPGFRQNVEKYSDINRILELLDKAVEESNVPDARAYFLRLKRDYDTYTWGSMVKLPLPVVTTPPGAEVSMNGRVIGKSPITLRYLPSKNSWVKIELSGFSAEQTTIKGDSIGLIRSVLNKEPNWSMTTKGAVDRRPVEGPRGRVFIVDRTGAVVAWSTRERKEIWRRETGDLSGLLTRPTIHGDHVIVASLDGKLRALNQADGKVVWTLPDLPSESALVAHGNNLVLASRRKLIFIDAKTRRFIRALPLSWTVRQDLLLVGGSVLVTQDDGTARLIDIESGEDIWEPARLDRGVVAEPMYTAGIAVFATDEGRVAALDVKTGQRVWSHTGLGEILWRPTSNGRRVFLATQPASGPANVLSFDLRTGEPGPRFHAPKDEIWSSHPAAIGASILVGSRSGIYRVLNAKTLELRYHISGPGAASAQPVGLRSGRTLVAFEGKRIFVYAGEK